MTHGNLARDAEEPAGLLFAGVAGSLDGDPDHRPPLILLHGLTFDRTTWMPVVAELRKLDPGRRVLAVDLPGHGRSPAWPSYDFEGIAEGVHRAARHAKLHRPVLVGHSAGAVVATIYASRYPARGVVNVDQRLQAEPLARLFPSLAGQLRGPGFLAAWEMVEASMSIGLLPEEAQELLRSARNPRQDLVTGYLRELFDRPAAEFARRAAAQLAALRTAQVPYLFVAGDEIGPDYRNWLSRVLPQATITVWPASGHFPHLAHPRRFAECLAATARWSAPPQRPAHIGAWTQQLAEPEER
jgi:pimeloyl-ACP methyl ester carboxylesterase